MPFLGKKLVLVAVLASALPAFAIAPDFTTLTGAVDFSTVGVAILAIGALMVVPKVIRWGVGRVLAMLGR